LCVCVCVCVCVHMCVCACVLEHVCVSLTFFSGFMVFLFSKDWKGFYYSSYINSKNCINQIVEDLWQRRKMKRHWNRYKCFHHSCLTHLKWRERAHDKCHPKSWDLQMSAGFLMMRAFFSPSQSDSAYVHVLLRCCCPQASRGGGKICVKEGGGFLYQLLLNQKAREV